MRMNRRVACLTLVAALLWVTSGGAVQVSSDAEEAAASARSALARLPPEPRLGEIKNERLRRAVQAAYHVVVELAANRDSGKVAALNSRFERAYAEVARETASGEYRNCSANCKALDGAQCVSKCKAAGKKVCGCKLIEFSCLVAECIF